MDIFEQLGITICDLCTHWDNQCKSELSPDNNKEYSGFHSSYNDQF